MFSRPVSSGWKPVPTSSSEATRPRSRTQPSVGSVIRLRIFRSVLLPAPLRPMMPTTSPGWTSNETLRQGPEGLELGSHLAHRAEAADRGRDHVGQHLPERGVPVQLMADR